MANKVNVDLDMNVEGYVQGINQATQSTEKYETETRKVADAQVNLMKELKAAKKEVQNLAAGYAHLDAEAKKSAFGKEMARQLEEAKQKASEYIDLQNDLNTELKNMASDTATFDALANGVSALGNTMSAVTGIMGIFTNDTEMMRKAVTMFTTAESIANAAIKVSNLLQKQSSLMRGINTLQTKAATAATNMNTAAVGTNTAITKAATVAQSAFNAVAKANPYVLLATAIIGVGTALYAFCSNAEDATEAQNKLTIAEENAKRVSETYASTLSNEFSKLMTNYTKLKAQWANLANDSQRKKFINEHKTELKNLGAEINNVKDAEGFFSNNTSKIVQAFQKRAQAAAMAAKAAELYRQQMEIVEKNRQFLESDRSYKEYDKAPSSMTKSITADRGKDTYNGGTMKMNNKGELYLTEKGAEAANKATKEWQDLYKAYRDVNEQIDNVTKQYEQLVKEGSVLSDTNTQVTNTTNRNTNATQKEISTYSDAIEEYDRLTKKYEELTNLKDRINPQYAGEFQKEIDAIGDKIQTLADKWHISAKIELEKPKNQDISQIEKAIEEALNPHIDVSKAYDFSALPEEYSKAANSVIDSIHRIEAAQEKLNKIMNANDASDLQIAKAQEGLKRLADEYDRLSEKADEYQKKNLAMQRAVQHFKEVQEAAEETGRTLESFGSIAGSVGSMFKTAGDDVSAAMMTVISATLDMVAQVVPQIMSLVAAKEAEAMASGTASAAKLPYPANLGAIASIIATILSTFATIYSAVKGAEGHAGGGIVGGSSYAGDKIITGLNSGEMVLNQRQQQNLFNMLDTGSMPQHGGSNVTVTGIIHGTDLLLVQKNTNKKLNKAGSSIHF